MTTPRLTLLLRAALAVALVSSGLLVGIAAPAHAAPAASVTSPGPILPGDTITISGTGFSPGQRLAVKMDHDSYGQIGADEGEDQTNATRGRIAVDENGEFHDEPVIVPRFTPAGNATMPGSHTLHLLDNDPVTTVPVPFTTEADFSYSLSGETTEYGGTVTVTGTGWVDRAGTGGSTVAAIVETAEGASTYARTAGHEVHAKPEVWAVTTADADGDVTLTFDLPDGTARGPGGSTPRIGGGDYGIRLRSGSWLGSAGQSDVSRSVELTGITLAERLAATSAPTVTGKPRVGVRLTGSPGEWSPSDGVVLSYAWLRDGDPVAGATASAYTPTAQDVGHRIALEVTGAHPSAGTATETSAVTATVAKGVLTVRGKPAVSGTTKVGKKLKASTGRWSPSSVKVKVQWQRNKKAIKGATGTTYRLAAKDEGTKVRAVVTASKAGYGTRKVTTAAKRIG